LGGVGSDAAFGHRVEAGATIHLPGETSSVFVVGVIIGVILDVSDGRRRGGRCIGHSGVTGS